MKLSLRALPNTDLQVIFDTVAVHMLTQGERALRPDQSGCAYRGENGSCCAVGCLIADNEYTEEMENKPLHQVLTLAGVPVDEHCDEPWFELLSYLRVAHDDFDPADWKHELKTIAENMFFLNTDALDWVKS